MEDHAAKVSVEEQMQVTTINTLEKDLDLGEFLFSQIFRIQTFSFTWTNILGRDLYGNFC